MLFTKIKSVYFKYRSNKATKRIINGNETVAVNYCKKHNVPDLNQEEKRLITTYWKQYGICLNSFAFHRMYYYVTGKHDPRFIPNYIAYQIVYPYYNDKNYINAWNDKNMFRRLLPDVPLPKTVISCIRGRFLINDEYIAKNEETEKAISKRIISEYDNKKTELIFKPSRGTGCGTKVKKYTITSEKDLFLAFKEWEKCDNFIVQECIKQHPAFSAFNDSSVNIIRVYSWRHGNDVDILFSTVRAGIAGHITDVSFIDGIETVHLIGITDDGFFMDKMLDQDGMVVKTLPNNVPVPAFDKIKEIIKKNHLLLDNFDIVGWDFTVDEYENPICIEWNIKLPGTVFYQYVNGPLWQDKTDNILSFLKSENNRNKYIPKCLKA